MIFQSKKVKVTMSPSLSLENQVIGLGIVSMNKISMRGMESTSLVFNSGSSSSYESYDPTYSFNSFAKEVLINSREDMVIGQNPDGLLQAQKKQNEIIDYSSKKRCLDF